MFFYILSMPAIWTVWPSYDLNPNSFVLIEFGIVLILVLQLGFWFSTRDLWTIVCQPELNLHKVLVPCYVIHDYYSSWFFSISDVLIKTVA